MTETEFTYDLLKQFDDEAVRTVTEFCNPEIKALEQFALDNYDAGGHWIVETYDPEDYALALLRQGSHETIDLLVAAAKEYLRRDWEHMNILEREYAFGDE
jgi:hypothetical protein